MATGLSVNRLIRTSVTLSPVAAQRRGFGILMVAGDSDVIDGRERMRTYTTIESVADDFGLNAPEYDAAVLYFGQSPKPATMMIGRWIEAATAGFNRGEAFTAAQATALLASLQAIANGSIRFTIDNTLRTVTALDFTSETNLAGCAGVIDTALASWATCEWNGSAFVVTSITTGASSSVSVSTGGAGGTDLSPVLNMSAADSAYIVPGYAAESPVECTAVLTNMSAVWFGLMFASTASITDQEHIDVAAYVEALDIERVYGITTTDTDVLDSTVTNDICSELKALSYERTFTQYSANQFAAASFFGRNFSVNFNANKSTITIMYKVEPGVAAETLTETQATTLKNKRCNVYVNYINDTAIIQYGQMASGAYFDEIHGLSWFKDALQNAEYNLLYQSKTKIPQTDSGQNQLITVASGVCNEAVNNGLVAPGTWNADGFGQLSRGDFLKSGFYIYTPPIALQDQSIRESRTAPPLQIALKLAGAIQELDIIVDVNR